MEKANIKSTIKEELYFNMDEDKANDWLRSLDAILDELGETSKLDLIKCEFFKKNDELRLTFETNDVDGDDFERFKEDIQSKFHKHTSGKVSLDLTIFSFDKLILSMVNRVNVRYYIGQIGKPLSLEQVKFYLNMISSLN